MKFREALVLARATGRRFRVVVGGTPGSWLSLADSLEMLHEAITLVESSEVYWEVEREVVEFESRTILRVKTDYGDGAVGLPDHVIRALEGRRWFFVASESIRGGEAAEASGEAFGPHVAKVELSGRKV